MKLLLESWRTFLSEQEGTTFDINNFLNSKWKGLVLKIGEDYVMVDPEDASGFVDLEMDAVTVPSDAKVKLLEIKELPPEIANILTDFNIQYPLQFAQGPPDIPVADNILVNRYKYEPKYDGGAYTLPIESVMTRDAQELWAKWSDYHKDPELDKKLEAVGMEIKDNGSWRELWATRTHDDGWTVTGEPIEDYYQWVNYFEAFHPQYGRVFGDFEKFVYYDTEEGLKDFLNNHPPEDWDYGDI